MIYLFREMMRSSIESSKKHWQFQIATLPSPRWSVSPAANRPLPPSSNRRHATITISSSSVSLRPSDVDSVELRSGPICHLYNKRAHIYLLSSEADAKTTRSAQKDRETRRTDAHTHTICASPVCASVRVLCGRRRRRQCACVYS